MMTYNTAQGPLPILVDVQSASKANNAKRHRNAVASQSFRQRRKDREKEAADKLAELEAQVREISKDKEREKEKISATIEDEGRSAITELYSHTKLGPVTEPKKTCLAL